MRDPANNNAVRINNSNNHNYVWTNSNSNTNENNIGQNRPRVIDPNNLRRMRRALMTFGGNNNRPNTSNYIQNQNKVKNNTSHKIPWKNMNVKNFPRDPITLENLNNAQKAVKINKLYLTPNSFRKLARMSMTSALNANGNMVLFKNPMTRANVKKGDLNFVILRRAKNT